MLAVVELLRPEGNHRRRRLGRREAAGRPGVAGPDTGAAPEPGAPEPWVVAGGWAPNDDKGSSHHLSLKQFLTIARATN